MIAVYLCFQIKCETLQPIKQCLTLKRINKKKKQKERNATLTENIDSEELISTEFSLGKKLLINSKERDCSYT